MSIARLREFVSELTDIVRDGVPEASILAQMRAPMSRLLANDDWLPDAFASPHPAHYQQYLLHCDPKQRFSVVSFVWGPGQKTPIHDHTVWGMIGMLRGSEESTRFETDGNGKPMRIGETTVLAAGDIDCVSPARGDVHRVRNVHDDRVSISIHVYGANIGRVQRHVFDPATGDVKDFVSGFSSDVVPNLWALGNDNEAAG
ncbi:cysteine dioxygenase family protein [Paraburkholderia susongensis]|uniref:Predicted metal-dependent enzyme of the double-stranded beta helix superfamily n=1 Tax=Paraburkholderia susongensis TaxID=1515439 RepID=A0A1X7LHJ2_9BURK|nr:cysteine dioxygenase [Paraburkholderia susongensis]SMG53245.1 Predicted metal-dependent enzyme of the double-stranded beta helix superfamily [Paraburkholderia susongensis]